MDQGSGCTTFVGSGAKTCHVFEIKDQQFGYKNGISKEQVTPRYDPEKGFAQWPLWGNNSMPQKLIRKVLDLYLSDKATKQQSKISPAKKPFSTNISPELIIGILR